MRTLIAASFLLIASVGPAWAADAADRTGCHVLVTVHECQIYRARLREAGTPVERASVQQLMQTLVEERSRACPCQTSRRVRDGADSWELPPPAKRRLMISLDPADLA